MWGDWKTIEVAGIFFLATLIRSTFGFGEALVAVPLLALIIPVSVAVPTAVLVSISVAAVVVLQDWRLIHLRSAGWLVASTFVGIPLGLLVLKTAPEAAVKIALALIIIGFSSYSLLTRQRHELKDERLAWIFGLSAGVLGGAYGMNGPPLVIYGTLRHWTPGQFRATLQGYFLPASLVGMVGYWVAGLWTRPVSAYYVQSLPLILVAILLGRAINRRLTGRRFLIYVHAGLIAIGAVLLAQTLHR